MVRLKEKMSISPILLVEDRDSNKMVCLLLLRKLGLAADAVASGIEAVEAASKCEYRAILMDVQMPEFDGFDATLAILKSSGYFGFFCRFWRLRWFLLELSWAFAEIPQHEISS